MLNACGSKCENLTVSAVVQAKRPYPGDLTQSEISVSVGQKCFNGTMLLEYFDSILDFWPNIVEYGWEMSDQIIYKL